MSNYSKITDFTTKDSTNALIEGSDFDNEFTAVATMSATKADKAIPSTANSVAGLNSVGNLYDSTITVAALTAAVASTLAEGMMLPYGGASAPSGFLLCDGTSYATASYADLFAIIGYDFGGSGANFNVPDLRGRVPAGQDNMGGVSADTITATAADSMAGESGTETHTLTTGEIPAHSHSGTTASDGAHTHSGYVGTSTTGASGDNKSVKNEYTTTTSNGAHTHTFSTDTDGGSGGAHSNVQPSLFMNYIIKT